MYLDKCKLIVLKDGYSSLKMHEKFVLAKSADHRESVVLICAEQVVSCHTVVCLIFHDRVLNVVNWVAKVRECLHTVVIYSNKAKLVRNNLTTYIVSNLPRATVKCD